MKGIRKTLVAGVLACSAFNTQAEISPFSYGVKGGVGTSHAYDFGDAKIKVNQVAKSPLFSSMPWAAALYGEYAFTDYIGLSLEAGYMQLGTKLEGTSSKNQEGTTAVDEVPSISMSSHGIYVPMQLCVYPMGREEGEGIFKLHAGGSMFVPFGDPKLRKNNKDMENSNLTASQKKEYPGTDFGILAGLGYEFPFGLFAEFRYNIGLSNRFNKESNKDQTLFDSLSITELKNMKTQFMTLNVGFNIASLFADSESV